MTTKAVSTDVDGVLHSSLAAHGPQAAAQLALASPQQWRERGLFCWAGLLEAVLQEIDAHEGEVVPLIIHSTWRKQPWVSLGAMRAALGPLGHRLMAMTSPDLAREDSIVDLAQRADLDSILVLDDSSAEFSPGRLSNLVITNPLTGVSDPAVLAQLRAWGCEPRRRNTRALSIPVL